MADLLFASLVISVAVICTVQAATTISPLTQSTIQSVTDIRDNPLMATSNITLDGMSLEDDSEGLYSSSLSPPAAQEPGWAWHPIPWSLITRVQLVTAIVGVVGNLLVIVVLLQRRKLNRSTDTLIGALAAADTITSICVMPRPFIATVPTTWAAYLYCKIIYGRLFLWSSITASIYTLVAISFDRFFAILFPLHFKRLVSTSKINACIGLVWVYSIGMSTQGMFVITVNEGSHTCVFRQATSTSRLVMGSFIFVVRLVLPTITMLVTQLLIARSLYRQSQRFHGDASFHTTGASTHLVARNRVIKMMLVVIIVYVICWGPNQIFYFGLNAGFISFTYLNGPMHILFIVIAYFNSCLNPFIYTVANPHFRTALKGLFTGLYVKREISSVFTRNDENIATGSTKSTNVK